MTSFRVQELVMTTDTFRRHARSCIDVTIHHSYASFSDRRQRAMFETLLWLVRNQSNLLVAPSIVRDEVAEIVALHNLARFKTACLRTPETWEGMRGHPLRVIASLANHMFGLYPTPRFLASCWFGHARERADHRRWFIAHARGQRFRSLSLPIAMTRRMEHFFLRTPDHLSVAAALRRAEVLGLGGSPELADAVIATRLGAHFDEPERWREVLVWLVSCDDVDLDDIRTLVEYLEANLRVAELRGRTFASMMRSANEWIGRARAKLTSWPRSPWRGARVVIEATRREPRRSEWTIAELLDSRELLHEGRAMRHCVAAYVYRCRSRSSSIWSLRHRWFGDDQARSVITIEVRPKTGLIVQMRGVANGRPSGEPLELVRRWAAVEGLRFDAGLRL
ncbi:MAG TPA: PcfJ domain-containing protein [Kofleriaceae bacterium]|nr:PcfJ domain-containing protein [Kofleriaceae bacterium]